MDYQKLFLKGIDMLVLSRNKDDQVMIGDNIEITIVDIRGDRVRLGITAQPDVPVHRKEVYQCIQAEGIVQKKPNLSIEGLRNLMAAEQIPEASINKIVDSFWKKARFIVRENPNCSDKALRKKMIDANIPRVIINKTIR